MCLRRFCYANPMDLLQGVPLLPADSCHHGIASVAFWHVMTFMPPFSLKRFWFRSFGTEYRNILFSNISWIYKSHAIWCHLPIRLGKVFPNSPQLCCLKVGAKCGINLKAKEMRMYWSYLFELMCVFLCVWKLVLFPCASDESQLAKSYCLLFQYILPLVTFGNVFACHVPVSSPLTPWKSHTNLVCCCNRSCYFAVAAADAIIDGTLKHQSSADPLSHADGPTPLKKRI